MAEFIPSNSCRILDVGCGSGGFGKTLKQKRMVEIWGVEPVASAAAIAATRLDRVIEGAFEPSISLPRAFFDCIVFNDVLEHLFDPAAALTFARDLLASGGCVVASIPNIRHFPTLWTIVVKKNWVYRDFGILDCTHLRFFTRNSIGPLFNECGFAVETLQGINDFCTPYPDELRAWRYFRILRLATFGGIDDMRFLQFAVVARPNPAVAAVGQPAVLGVPL